jgi:hypothetical protein
MARLHVVGDGGEQPARLDGGRQLALLIEHGARIAAASASLTTNMSGAWGRTSRSKIGEHHAQTADPAPLPSPVADDRR